MKTKKNINKITLQKLPYFDTESIVEEPIVAYQTFTTKPAISTLTIPDDDNITFWKALGIKQDISSDSERLKLIKSGVSKRILNHMMAAMEISLEDMADILHTTDRTLRRYDDNTILNMEQSERILELVKLYGYGKAVFGNMDKFKLWVNDSIMALGNHKPKEFLDTSLGIQMLMQILGRMEYGVYS